MLLARVLDDLLVELKSATGYHAATTQVCTLTLSHDFHIQFNYSLFADCTARYTEYMECIFQLFTDHCKQLTDDDKLPEKATESLEAQMSQLKKVAAKRLILVVLDGGFQLDFLLLSDHRSFSRHVGRGARTPILMH